MIDEEGVGILDMLIGADFDALAGTARPGASLDDVDDFPRLIGKIGEGRFLAVTVDPDVEAVGAIHATL